MVALRMRARRRGGAIHCGQPGAGYRLAPQWLHDVAQKSFRPGARRDAVAAQDAAEAQR
jgi:hypothetical protein